MITRKALCGILVVFAFLLAACGGGAAPAAQSTLPVAAPTAIESKWTIEALQHGAPAGAIRSLFEHKDILYAGTNDGIFTYDGSWHQDLRTINFGLVNAMAVAEDGVLYAGSDALNNPQKQGGLWRLNGDTWERALPYTVFSFGQRGKALVAATWEGLYELQEDGSTWKAVYNDQNFGYSVHFHAYTQLRSMGIEYDCMGTVNKGVICVNPVDLMDRYVMHSGGEDIGVIASNEIRFMLNTTESILVATEGGGIAILMPLQWPANSGKFEPGILGPMKPEFAKKVSWLVFDSAVLYAATLDKGVIVKEGFNWVTLDPTPANTVLIHGSIAVMGTTKGIKAASVVPPHH